MFMQKKKLHSAFLLGLLMLVVPSVASAADISPYLDMETIAVVRMNLKQLDIPGIQKYVEGTFIKAVDEVIPKDDPLAPMMKQATQESGGMPESFHHFSHVYDDVVKNGVEEVFIISYRDAITQKMFQDLYAIPIPEGASQEAIDTIRMQYLNTGIPVTFVRHGFIVGIPLKAGFANQKKVMEFAREKFKNPSTQPRPEIVEALSSQSTALLQIVIGKIDHFQKDVDKQINAFKPMLMMAPKEQKEMFESVTKLVPTIFQGLNTFNFVYDYGKPEIKVSLKLKDEKTAKAFLNIASDNKKQAEKNIDQTKTLNSMMEFSQTNIGMTAKAKTATKEFVQAIQEKQQGSEVTILIDSSGMERMKNVVGAITEIAVSFLYMSQKAQMQLMN